MKKFSLDIIDDVLYMIENKCPNHMYDEFTEFQCDCEIINNCFDCWCRTVRLYQFEQSLKSGNNESEDK